MNSLPLWCGVDDHRCEPTWDSANAAAALRLTEMLQVLNDAFDTFVVAEAATRSSEAA
jgi:hypothetical protein